MLTNSHLLTIIGWYRVYTSTLDLASTFYENLERDLSICVSVKVFANFAILYGCGVPLPLMITMHVGIPWLPSV